MKAAQRDGCTSAPSGTFLSWERRVWWVALAALVLNDHVLKTAGLLPGWLTGKVSDFAGLVVAPVLLTTMTRVRGPVGRIACFGLIAGVFVAIKVSPAAARALETAMGGVGIPWRLWTDPTDLIALVALPLAWRVAAHGPPRPTRAGRTTPGKLRETVGVVAGAAACLATSGPGRREFKTTAFLANVSYGDTTVEIFRARAPLDCAAILADPATALATAPFDPEACWTLGVGEMVPLARNWVRWDYKGVTSGPGGPTPQCDAVIVRVGDQLQALVSWQNIGDVEIDALSIWEGQSYDLDPHGMYLEQLRDRLYLAPSTLIRSQPLALSLPAITACVAPDPDGTDGGVP